MADLLGKTVKDTVSGFTGVVTGEHKFLAGCTRYSVQPPIDKDGKLPDHHTFDEPQLEVIPEEEVVVKGEKPGGPMPVTPKEKSAPSR